jgi:hypothetical protein
MRLGPSIMKSWIGCWEGEAQTAQRLSGSLALGFTHISQ